MEEKNIDLFNRYTGSILKLLYENFPVCYGISTLDIVEDTLIDKDKKELVCSETMFWLKDSGFITFVSPKDKTISLDSGTVAYYKFSCAVLTAKGLEILKQIPQSIKPRETLGDKLVEAVSKNAPTMVTDIVSTAISGSLKFLWW